MAKQKKLFTRPVIGLLGLVLILPIALFLVQQATRLNSKADGRPANLEIDTSAVLGPLPEPWRAVAQGGENLDTFMTTYQSQVRGIAPKLVRIDHIYDQFNVVSRTGSGLAYNWTGLDKVVRDIQSTGAKPFLSLSYMPPAIAMTDIVSEPRNWDEWSAVVEATIEHYSGTLGIEGVYYEVWNEPDLFGGWKMGGVKDYKKLYLYAARGAARANGVRKFYFGGPATTGLYKNWVNNFFPYVLANNLRLDFFSWHRYSLDLGDYIRDVAEIDMLIEGQPYFANIQKIITELGPDAKAGGANNTRTGAAHLVAVMRELMYKISYGFSFSVSGAWGIVGTPRYEALRILNRLGDVRLPVSGEGSWVRAIGAKNGTTIQILLVNYDPTGSNFETVPVTFTNLADSVFMIRRIGLAGEQTTKAVATSEATYREMVPMTPNSVVMIELVKLANQP